MPVCTGMTMKSIPSSVIPAKAVIQGGGEYGCAGLTNRAHTSLPLIWFDTLAMKQPSHPPYSASNSLSASFRSSGEFMSAFTMGLSTSIR